MAGTAPPPEDTDEARWAFQQRAQAEELSRPPVAGLERTEQLLAEYKDSAAFRNHVLVRREAVALRTNERTCRLTALGPTQGPLDAHLHTGRD